MSEANVHGRGGELLHGEQSVDNTGEAVAQGNEGRTVPDSVQSNGENVASQGNQQVSEPVGNSEQLSSSEIPNYQSVAEGDVPGQSGVAKAELQDARAFAEAYSLNTVEAYQAYLDRFPEGAYRDGARNGIWTLEGTEEANSEAIERAMDVIAQAPSGVTNNNASNALQSGNNDLNLQKENEPNNEPNQNDIPVGGQVPQSVPQGEYGEDAAQVGGAQETAARLRERIESAQGDSKSGLREVENRVTREFAQENGLWIEDEFKLGVPFPSGDEHNNYIDAENQVVYKVNNRMHTPSILDLLDRIEQHNKYFPNTQYRLVGFTAISKNGDVMPVFAQGFVPDARMATIDEIDSYMGTLGFTRVGDGRYSNGEVVIKDLKPRNVLADADGDIYVVDAEFEQEKAQKGDKTAENESEKMYSPEELAEAKEQLGELNAISAPAFAARLFSIKPWKTLEEANAALKELLASYGETLNGQTAAVLPFLDEAQRLIGENSKNQEPRSTEDEAPVTSEPTEQPETDELSKAEAVQRVKRILTPGAEGRRLRMLDRVKRWEKLLGVEIVVHESTRDITNDEALAAIAEAEKTGKAVQGWFDGKGHIYLPHNFGVADIDATALHEVVAHMGIKEMLSPEQWDEFRDKVWEAMSEDARERYLSYVGADLVNPSQENRRAAADEYVAALAERVDMGRALETEDRNVWQKFCDAVRKFFAKKGEELDAKGILSLDKLTDGDIANMVRVSFEGLKAKDGKVSQGESETRMSKKMSERRQEKNRINNVLDEVGGILYGNKEYAKKQRLKREAERKELAKEIYSSVLKGDFNDVTLAQIDKFIEDATPANPFGRRISQRLPQRMERALRAYERTNAVDALFSRISESAVPANERFSEAGRREIEERKKELLKGWAIATGNWHTDLKEFTDDTEPIGEGQDSKVYSAKEGPFVIKASKGKPFGKRFRPDIDNIALFNDVFRNSRYEILGYGEIDGDFVRILKQRAVDFSNSTPLAVEERVEYMRSLGFEPINKDNTAFSNGEIVIADLQKSNIVRDVEGDIRVIDADAKLHTKDVGGDYTYPPVETDLPEGTDLGGTMFRKVTPEMDAEYMAAVENGDMETAERLVKEAAKLAMPDTKVVDEDGYPMVVYHGSGPEMGKAFTVFDNGKSKYKSSNTPEEVSFFSKNRDVAASYTLNGENIELNTKDLPYTEVKYNDGRTEKQTYSLGGVYSVYLNLENPLVVDADGANWDEILLGEQRVATNDIALHAKENGYDGVIFDNIIDGSKKGLPVSNVYATTSPNQIKSADAVTYDDNGNVIPLSERFNEEKEDIRFRKAFHGSGAKFDRFDHSFMGTGEGAQAFGWGTYVTEVEGIGRTYATTMRDKLISEKHKENATINKLAKQTLESSNGNKEEALDYLRGLLNESWSDKKRVKAQIKIIETGKFLPETKLKANLYTVEIPDDNGSNYLHWDKPINGEIQERIANGLQSIGFEIEPGMNHLAYSRDGKIAVLNINAKGKDLYAELSEALGGDKAASLFLNNLGFVGISYPANATTGGRADGARNYVIFNENDAQIESRTMFRRANKNQEVFVSNAQRAVEGIKQEKATPEQWIAMLKKNGGLKAGEEAWLGLEEWLNKKQGAVTKQEILDFIGENKIQIEEVNYTQFGYGLMDEATRKLEAELKEIGWDAMVEKYPGFDELFEVYNGELLWSEERASVGEYEDFIIDNKIVDLDSQSNAINETREKYTTEGLERKREIALTVPTIEPYNASDEVHFGDAGNGRAVAWVRFGETADSEGNRVLVIDEIQSKRHQDGREKGYKDASNLTAEKQENGIWHIFDNGEFVAPVAKWNANTEQEAVEYYAKDLIPSAPFEKNWHELAMKRMLRLAAEEGFDKVAWTTGEQQAERYNIGAVVNRIESNDTVDYDSKLGVDLVKQVVLFTRDGNAITLRLTPEGIVRASSQYNGHHISDIVGKELGNRIMTETDLVLKEQDLRIGGEGMKGFYDRMLPSFVSKYTKKWGAKVGEVTMPNLGENNTMHSVDVTPEMQESVMEGQTMFRKMDYDEAVKMGEEFVKVHKGAAPVVVINTFDTLEEQLREKGFSNGEIERAKVYYNEGTSAVYFSGSDHVVVNKHNVSPKKLNGYLWHENGHRAFDKLYGDNQDICLKLLKENFTEDEVELIKADLLDDYPDYWPEEAVMRFFEQAMTDDSVLDDNGYVAADKVPGMKDNLLKLFNDLAYQINNGEEEGQIRADEGRVPEINKGKEALAMRNSEGTESLAAGEESEIRFRVGEPEIAKGAAMAVAERLNVPVAVVEDSSTLPENERGKKGWIDKDGNVSVVLDNHISTEDVVETVLHEVVGKKGLRAVFGDKFDELLDAAYSDPRIKQVAGRMFFESLKNGRAMTLRQCTEKLLADLARKGFKGYEVEWNAVRQQLRDLFSELTGIEVSDNELRYLLWKNSNKKNGFIETVENRAMEVEEGDPKVKWVALFAFYRSSSYSG